MSYRILVIASSTDKVKKGIVKELRSRPSVEHVVHFGGVNSDYKVSSLLKMSVVRASGQRGHIMVDDQFTGDSSALATHPDYYQFMNEAIDHLHRASGEFRYRSHKLNNFFDYQHYYHVVVDRVYSIIRSERINLILLFDIPHLFYDTTIYQVAKINSIDILILRQALWPDRYFSCRSVSDFGVLPKLSKNCPENIERFTIDEHSMPNLFYMQGVSQNRDSKGRLTLRGAVHLLAFLATSSPTKLFNVPYVFKMMRRMHHLAGKFPQWRDPFSSFFHRNSLLYFETLAQFEEVEPDLTKSFVYFPLHLQPEMTTSALGGKFSDQLLAIERVAELIPDDWRIFVKENPRQIGKMRRPMFFHRLWRIKKVDFLSSHANTHVLTEHAKFVATITGTVGWEAICRGKVALVFGRPWYTKLPGIFVYRSGLKLNEILDFSFSQSNLEKRISELLHRSHFGTLHRHDAREIEEFDAEKNGKKISDTVLDLISGKIEPTFLEQ